jgi:ribosomal protein S18 acetylase RimI-like enzyme
VQRYDEGVSIPVSPGGEFVNRPSEHPFIIRTARQNDLNILADVLAQSFHTQEGVGGWLYPLLRMGIYEDLRTRIRSKALHHACLVAVSNVPTSAPISDVMRKNLPALGVVPGMSDPIVGTIEIGLRAQPFWQLRYKRQLYLSNLAVKREYRRKGIAQQLLLVCERIALDWGYTDLYLHVLEDNQPARRMYLKAGYEVMQVESSLGSWILGRSRQLFLHKQLSRSSELS